MADMTVLAAPEVFIDPRTNKYTERRACCYCWSTFTVKRAGQTCCSSGCSQRISAWDHWLTLTRLTTIGGDINKTQKFGPALPAGGESLRDGIASGAVQLVLEEVAA